MKNNYLLYVLFFIGLAIKIAGLPFIGSMCDMHTYSRWGTGVLEKGLKVAYQGIYYPFQYQIFALTEFIHDKFNFNSDSYAAYKVISLCFDIGNFLVLVKIFRKYSLNILYASLYWLLPWFFNILWLGYIDFGFTFFILLFIYLYTGREDRPLHNIIYGIPLGIALMMKPQVQILVLFLGIYLLVEFYRKRTYIQMLVFLPSIILYISYATIIGWKALTFSYINTANVMPALSAYMLNFWYPVAYFLREPNQPIAAVPDTIITFYNLPILRILAICIILFISYKFISKLKESNYNILFIFTLASLMLPFIMTSAHSHHLFLGTVLLCLCIPIFNDKKFTLFALLLICIQQINIFGYYQLGTNPYFTFEIHHYYFIWHIDLILSVISCILFIAILQLMAKKCLYTGKTKIRPPKVFLEA